MGEIERCSECGFDGAAWSDDEAIEEIGRLPERWRAATQGLDAIATATRPFQNMWSIGEYADHVREVVFGMRFVLDIAVESPGTDLGSAPSSEFSTEPATVDIDAALDRFADEASLLTSRLRELTPEQWTSTVIFDSDEHDARWICRHAVHDATHHLDDIERLKQHLG